MLNQEREKLEVGSWNECTKKETKHEQGLELSPKTPKRITESGEK